MSQESVERFLGRVITDERFRHRAQASLDQCCTSDGYCFSPTELAHLAKIDYRLLGFVATTLDGEILRH